MALKVDVRWVLDDQGRVSMDSVSIIHCDEDDPHRLKEVELHPIHFKEESEEKAR